jgi:hypothetical protein
MNGLEAAAGAGAGASAGTGALRRGGERQQSLTGPASRRCTRCRQCEYAPNVTLALGYNGYIMVDTSATGLTFTVPPSSSVCVCSGHRDRPDPGRGRSGDNRARCLGAVWVPTMGLPRPPAAGTGGSRCSTRRPTSRSCQGIWLRPKPRQVGAPNRRRASPGSMWCCVSRHACRPDKRPQGHAR